MIEYRIVKGAALVALGERNAEPVRAVATPFSEWNDNCGGRGGCEGLAHGWHVLAAGRSGEGKTYLAVNIAAAAIQAAQSVTFHSLEMDWDELSTRVLGIVSGEHAWRLSPGKHYSPEAYNRAKQAMNATRGELHINNEPMFKLTDLLEGIRRNFDQHESRLHIIDYLQLAWTGAEETQAARITEVSHSVRQMAQQLGIVTFCLSQFNRATSTNQERPTKEGMIGGSALENDANQVVLLDHSRRTSIINSQGKNRGWTGWLNLDKNRHGAPADIPIRYDADTGRMRQRMPDEVLDAEVKK